MHDFAKKRITKKKTAERSEEKVELKQRKGKKIMVTFGIFLVVAATVAEALIVSKKIDLGE